MKEMEQEYPISELLCSWYSTNKRVLPWRGTTDPYRIWLSEIILQQTRIAQGIDYYRDFIESFPDVFSLAEASEETVLKHWQGLGYYSRARHLHATARLIAARYRGVFPHTYEELLHLKGIGPYTAAAIASFAFYLPVAVLDGNVYRVLARLYDIDLDIRDNRAPKLFQELAQATMNPTLSAMHNQAIMDFGATLCTPKRPLCRQCPLQDKCLAYAHNTVQLRPVRSQGSIRRERFLHYLFLHNQEGMWMHQRHGKDIWQHLWEFPMVEAETRLDFAAMAEMSPLLKSLSAIRCKCDTPVCFKHILTHQTIHATFFPILTEDFQGDIPGEIFITNEELAHYAIPRPIDKFLSKRTCCNTFRKNHLTVY